MLAAEAKKAGSASVDTLLTPRPPSLIVKDACSHCESDKLQLVMRVIIIIIIIVVVIIELHSSISRETPRLPKQSRGL